MLIYFHGEGILVIAKNFVAAPNQSRCFIIQGLHDTQRTSARRLIVGHMWRSPCDNMGIASLVTQVQQHRCFTMHDLLVAFLVMASPCRGCGHLSIALHIIIYNHI